MKLLQESIEFIRDICREIPFEIWAINNYNKEIVTVYGEGKIDVNKYIPYKGKRIIDDFIDGSQKYYVFNFPENIKVMLIIDDINIELSEENLDRLFQSFFSVYDNELINIKKREVKILLDSISAMSTTLDKDELLEKIIESSINILGKADAGYIQIYDETRKLLKVESAYGFNENIYKFFVAEGSSITGKVYQDGKSRVYTSREDVLKDIDVENMSEENIRHLELSRGGEDLRGLISVAIQYRDSRIGVLTLIKTSEGFPLNQSDSVFLESFAAQAGVTLMNHELYSEVKNNLEKLERLNKELSSKNYIIDLKNEIYREVSRLSLTNESLSKVTEAFAKIIDIPLILYNKIRNVIEFDNLELEYTDLEELIDSYSYNSEGEVEYRGLYFHTIENGDMVLGYIITSKDFRENEDFYSIFKEGITVITLEVMKKYSLVDTLYKKAHEDFTRLLKSTDKGQMLEYADSLNIRPGEDYSAAIIEIRNYNNLQILELDIHKLVIDTRNALAGYEFLIYGFHNKINIIFTHKEEVDLDDILTRIAKVIDQWKDREDTIVFSGLGGVYTGIENISKSYDEAYKSLKYLSSQGDINIVRYDSIGINSLFVNQTSKDIDKFVLETLGPLRTEQGQKSNLEETLFTYIDLNKSAVKTAEKLYIHINTLYKRIEKIEELLNISFENPEDNLKIQLACYLVEENLNNED